MAATPSFEEQCYPLLQAGLDHINQGITVFDSGLRLVGWNHRFMDLLNLPPRLVYRGADFASLIRYNAQRGEYGPGDIEDIVDNRIRLAQRFEPHFLERRRPSGQILEIRGEPLPEGGFVTVYTDVTEQRRYERLIHEHTEELEQRVQERTAALQRANEKLTAAVAKQKQIAAALARSEALFQLIADSLPAGIAYWDSQERCLFANRRFAAAFGWDKSDIIGHSALEVVGAERLATLTPYLDRARQGESVTFEFETAVAGGRSATVRTNLIPDFDQRGVVVGFFVLSIDITRQKKAEAAILQAEKMEAVGELSSGIAHDFNNLLTVVLGNLMPLAEHLKGREEVGEFLTPAIEAAQKGAKSTQRLLSFARRQTLEPRAVDVEELIASIVRLFRGSLPSNIEIVTASGGKPYPALADPHQLENALVNLALNARDAMPKGGQLRFETSYVTCPQPAEPEPDGELPSGDYVKICVADDGVGMTATTRARVFEPFFTTKQERGGSGLGLSMVYGFVRQSYGGIRIDSTPGHGTRVTILLPRAAVEDDGASASSAPAAIPAASDDLVLLVEDDPQVRAVVRRQLVGLGFRLVEAANAAEALELLDNVPDFTVLVSDVVMPGTMTGIDLGRQAKTRRAALRVVLMTAHAGGRAVAGLDGCPFPVLRKPFDERQLAAAIVAAPAA